MHQTTAGGTKRHGRRWSVAISVPSGAKGYFRIRTGLSALFAKAVVGNTRETIAWVHNSFAMLFSRLLIRHASNLERSHEKRLSNGTVSNRDFLSEISCAFAARILDGTSAAFLATQIG